MWLILNYALDMVILFTYEKEILRVHLKKQNV